jgi:glucose-1-phosphate cytidylyltransferase
MPTQAVILAGGLGTRIAEESVLRPKPMVEIGGKPILWHIMKIYSAFGIHDFVICLGYRGYQIKEYFANYLLHTSDVTVDMTSEEIRVHHRRAEPWSVTLVDTGEHTETAGRLLRVKPYLSMDQPFCFTYGDGLTDASIRDELSFHDAHGKLVTTLAVRPAGRYGALRIEGDTITSFVEKPLGDDGWISGGFFVVSPPALAMIDRDSQSWERDILPHLAQSGQVQAFRHTGFWKPMDTMREKSELESLWASHQPPWRSWE